MWRAKYDPEADKRLPPLVDPERAERHERAREAAWRKFDRDYANRPEHIAARQAAARATITEREQRRQTLAAGRRKKT